MVELVELHSQEFLHMVVDLHYNLDDQNLRANTGEGEVMALGWIRDRGFLRSRSSCHIDFQRHEWIKAFRGMQGARRYCYCSLRLT